ncbi:MAG: hypothetical protein M0T78_05615 [Actinomycetota bacterium]|nr:hypothetical protein [Actinomycetota bacterium]
MAALIHRRCLFPKPRQALGVRMVGICGNRSADSGSTCTSSISSSDFWNIYGPFVNWASEILVVQESPIATQWYFESGQGACGIVCPYNNPANYGGSGPANTYTDICAGVQDGYIDPFSDTSLFAVTASDGNGRTAAQYIEDAWNNGFTVPPTNGYVSVPGAGTSFGPGFDAACAALGAMGWAQSNYYTSGDSPNSAGNIIMNWNNTYFSSLFPVGDIGFGAVPPSCCP